MKLAGRAIASFLAGFAAKPDPALRAILVFGPDAGLVRERADRLAAAVVPDLKDAFRVTDLPASALAGDPARLGDEAASQSLVGGRRLVRLRDAGDAVAALFASFLKTAPAGGNLILVEGGDLPLRSTLRRAFEATEGAVALPCYADGPRELGELVREVLGASGITCSAEATAYLVAHLGGDRAVSRSELEKLALYAGERGRVGLAEAMACVGDSAELTIDDVVHAAAEGDAAALERALLRAFQEGESPVGILRALMRHFQRLHLCGALIQAGASPDAALRGLRPPVFYQLQDRLKAQLRLWPARRAAQVLVSLVQAELNAKRTVLPPETICREALLRVARYARAKAA